MKRQTVAFMIMALGLMSSAFGQQYKNIRIVEVKPSDTNNVATISITRPSILLSVVCEIGAASETNSWTTTFTSVSQPTATTYATNTYTLAAAVVDQIAAAETVQYYNTYNGNSATTNLAITATQWLKQNDDLKFTGNDGTQTAYSNVTYRAVLGTL